MPTEKWTVVQYNVSKLLNEMHPARVKIPEGWNLTLVVDLDTQIMDRLEKDPVWSHRIQEGANAKVLPILAGLKTHVKDIDAKAAKFNVKTAQIFTNDLNSYLKTRMEEAGKEMVKEVDRFLEEYKKGQKDLLKFRAKSGAKIGANTVAIVGAVAVAGATHGALAPVSVVAIARSGIVITQECAKLAATADQIAKLIQGEFFVLKKIMIEDLEKAKKSGKVSQSAKEMGLGFISGALGIEIPNLKNCKSHIEVHKVDIAKLDAESHKLGKTVNDAMAAATAWEAKFKAAEATLSKEKADKVEAKQDAARKTLRKILEATFKVNASINRANERQGIFEKAINAMMKGMPEWVGLVQTVTTLALDIGLAVAGAGTAIEQGLGAVIAMEIDIGSELLDRG